MLVTLPIDRVVTLFFTPEDKAHNPAPVDGVPFWSLSEPGLIEVFPSADGLAAEARPLGKLGMAQVVVTADARLGPDIKNITGIYQINIVGGEAVSLNLGVGELRPFPEPVEPVEPVAFSPASVAETEAWLVALADAMRADQPLSFAGSASEPTETQPAA